MSCYYGKKHIGFSEEQKKKKMRKEAVLDYIETSENLKQSKKEKNQKNNMCSNNDHHINKDIFLEQ
ncbi:MAG: hypothetical protein L6V81_10315 [Clostridium sp.]|nr:MAG: hypothetical protein L6V81_10315 [Clostridium sp.]